MRRKRETKLKNSFKTKLPPYILSGMVIILLILQVVISNHLATTGNTISQIESEIAMLEKANARLKEQIASASSLMTLEQKAQMLGFTKPQSPIFLSDELPIALGPR